MRRKVIRSAGLITLLTAVACTAAEDRPDPEAVAPWRVSDQPVLRVGEVDGPSEYLFSRVTAVRLIPGGGLVVADAGLANVRLFDSMGNVQSSFGREGEGPGEFAWLRHLEAIGDTVLVYDPALFRLTRFDDTGRLLNTTQIDVDAGAPEVFAGLFGNGDMALGAIRPAPRDESTVSSDEWMLGRYSVGGEHSRSLGIGLGYSRLRGRPVPFSTNLHAVVLDDSLFVVDDRRGVVSVVNGEGVTARTFPVEVPRPSSREAQEMLMRAVEDSDDEVPFLSEVPEAAWQEPVPAISHVLVDRGARQFWLKHYEPTTDSWLLGGLTEVRGGLWTVVSAGGAPVARIDLPLDFVPLDLGEALIAGVERDDLGVERVVVYEVIRSEQR